MSYRKYGDYRGARHRDRSRFESLEHRHLLASDFAISEFLAVNTAGIADEDGDRSDWIEIHNTAASARNLEGWYLTDSDGDLEKWRLPNVAVPADGYVLVYASGKDRGIAGSQLHTNFSLAGAGEYLALVEPDGNTIASEFAPTFPEQIADVSYGIALDVDESPLVVAGGSARVRIPPNGALGSTWTARDFVDSGWTAGPTGVGYETGLPGQPPADPIAYWTLDDTNTDSSGHNYNGSLQGPSYSSDVPAAIGSGKSLSFNGTSDVFYSPNLNSSFVGDESMTVGVWFKARAGGHGGVVVDELGQASINTNWHDSQIEVQLDGEVRVAVWSLPWVSLGVASFGQWHHAVVRYNKATQTLDGFLDGVPSALQVAGDRSAPWEFGANQYWALGGSDFTQLGNGQFFDGQIDDFAVWNKALTNVQVAALAAGASPQGLQGYTSLIGTDVAAAMAGINPTAYVRQSFNLDSNFDFDTLKLRMRYDDGFVAYLNGQEVARRNAPATPTWNSAATANRTKHQATAIEEIDLTPHLGSLLEGANVLAIHALNDAPGSSDFLMLPELSGFQILGTAPRYFVVATPGVANNESVGGFVDDTKFSIDRGFFDDPIDVEITTTTPQTTIRYTTDGTAPTAITGTLYTGPVHIASTTTLRAAAFRPGYRSTNVDTVTYIFLDQVLVQSGAGLPPSWNGAQVDYAMDPTVVFGAAYQAEIKDNLLSIPTMSLVTAPGDMFESSGLYANPGATFERPVSVEIIYPDGSEGVQIDAGLRMHGGASRDPNFTPKHSFRLTFKTQYGASKFDYKLFDDSEVKEFDTLILRAHSTDSWTVNEAQPYFGKDDTVYLRDLWMRNSQLAMGGASAHGNYMHLYINGLYWGLYDPSERPDASFAASYYGGEKEEYDAIRDGEAVDGDFTAWNTMFELARQDLTIDANYQALQQYLDVDNLIDYCLLHIYAYAEDWSWHDYTAQRHRSPEGRFRFSVWDQEITNQHLAGDLTDSVGANNPSELYQLLRANPEFRLRVADHAQKLFFNDGVLAPGPAAARFQALADQIHGAVVGESARWGDSRTPGYTYTRDVNWQTAVNWAMNTYFPARTQIVVQQLAADGLFPSVLPPTFSQHGGTVPPGFHLTLDAPTGQILYTTDGSDPRLPGGGISPSALVFPPATTLVAAGAASKVRVPANDSLGTTWTSPTFSDAGWTSGATGIGYDTGGAAVAGGSYSPIAYYKLNLNTLDSSGNNFTGTRFEGSYSSAIPPATGVGLSLQLDGVNDYFITPDLASLANVSKSMTATVWFNADVGGGGGVVLDELGQPQVDVGWHDSQIEIQASGAVLVRVWPLGAVYVGQATFGQWHHATVRYNVATQTLDGFLDGVKSQSSVIGDRQSPWQFGAPQYYALGARDSTHMGNDKYFQGRVDDLTIWNRALSDAEVSSFSPPSSYTSLIATNIGAAMRNINASAYVRSTFNVADVTQFDTLTLKMQYDDGFVAYLNGQEVARRNAPATPTWNSAATADRAVADGRSVETIDISAFVGSLQVGTNVLAIHGLNDAAASTDFLVRPQLIASKSVTISASTQIRTRVLAAGVWSALDEAAFVLTTPPALRVTELMYRPADPPIGSPYSNSDFEFIELQNVSAQPMPLAGIEFSDGIEFTFGAQTLAPGEYVLVVANLAAFESRYGAGLNVAGAFTGSLNNAGETIELLGAFDEVIHNFAYSPTWYPVTNGTGRSLVINNALAAPATWNQAASWRPSQSASGSPGLADPAATIVGRRVFYNNSKFDGNNPVATTADDAAIATDKAPLLPGGLATNANYTNFSRGINGIMVDIAGAAGSLSASDFAFRVGNDDTPGGWLPGPASISVSTRVGAGTAGSNRVTLVWADGAIANKWLQVTVLSTAATALSAPDVFYFGNAIGEIGNSTTSFVVNASDEIATRSNSRSFLNPASIEVPHDFNRDGLVNATDQILARTNSTTLVTALQRISLAGLAAQTAATSPELSAARTVEVAFSDPAWEPLRWSAAGPLLARPARSRLAAAEGSWADVDEVLGSAATISACEY